MSPMRRGDRQGRTGASDVEPPMTLRRSMLLSTVFRAITLPIGAICSVVSAGLIIQQAGTGAYGLVSVLGNLFQLFVFTDLGLGAVVVPFLATRGVRERSSADLRSLGRVFRLLWIAALVVAVTAWSLAVVGVWPRLLGTAGLQQLDEQLNWATAVTLTVFAISIPLGMGQRVLLGLHANHVITLLGVLAPLASLGWTVAVVFSGLPVMFAGAGASIGLLVTAIAWMISARRRLMLPLRVVLGLDIGRPIPIWNLALPQLVITLLAPIGIQADRIVLAQASTADQLAVYSLVSQLWTPLQSVVYVATASLWPAFQSARSGTGRMLRSSWLAVGGASMVAGAAFVLLGAFACRIVSGGAIIPSSVLLLLFAALFVVMAVTQVSTLFLMDANGLRVQVGLVGASLAVNLTVSILLAPAIGAAGPLIGSLSGIVLVQAVPSAVLAWRRAHSPAVQVETDVLRA